MICMFCKKTECEPNKKSCSECLRKKREQTAARSARLDAAGMCRCGKHPIVEGKRACEACLQRRLQYTKDWQAKQQDQGLCKCGKAPPVDGKKMCAECAQKTSEKSMRFYRKNQAAGMCYTCGKVPPIDGSIRCLTCRDRHRENQHLHNYGLPRGEVRKMIDAQGGKCSICKCELGDNFHVDHNHETNVVRGILCHACNTFLGKYEKRQQVLQQFDEYIKLGT